MVLLDPAWSDEKLREVLDAVDDDEWQDTIFGIDDDAFQERVMALYPSRSNEEGEPEYADDAWTDSGDDAYANQAGKATAGVDYAGTAEPLYEDAGKATADPGYAVSADVAVEDGNYEFVEDGGVLSVYAHDRTTVIATIAKPADIPANARGEIEYRDLEWGDYSLYSATSPDTGPTSWEDAKQQVFLEELDEDDDPDNEITDEDIEDIRLTRELSEAIANAETIGKAAVRDLVARGSGTHSTPFFANHGQIVFGEGQDFILLQWLGEKATSGVIRFERNRMRANDFVFHDCRKSDGGPSVASVKDRLIELINENGNYDYGDFARVNWKLPAE